MPAKPTPSLNPQESQGLINQDGCCKVNTAERVRCKATSDLHERQSQHVRRGIITAAEEERTPGEVASVHVRQKTRSPAPTDQNKTTSRTKSLILEDTLGTTGYRRAVAPHNLQVATNHTIDSSIVSDEDSNNAEVSSLPLLPDGGTTGNRESAWPPHPPSILNVSSGTELHSPNRPRDTSQGHQDRGRSALLVHEETLKTAVEREETQAKVFERYRYMGFVERQELEQIAAGRRREELLRAEEEARCQLASGRPWMNRSSRKIFARSSSSPPCDGGGGGGSCSSPKGAGGRGQGISVFERLARCTSDNHMGDYNGRHTGTWMQETAIAGDEDGCARDRQLFKPTIDPRSNLIASRMPRRNEDGHGCPQQRLYREGQEQARRRQRRVQLADQAVREKAASCHVNPGSERVLVRRSRSRVIRFRSKMMEVLKVRFAHKYRRNRYNRHARRNSCVMLWLGLRSVQTQALTVLGSGGSSSFGVARLLSLLEQHAKTSATCVWTANISR